MATRSTHEPLGRHAATGWRVFLSALAVAFIALVFSAYAFSETRADWSRGYIDVGVRKKNSSEWVWRARHDRARSPLKFYAHLLRPASLAVALVLLFVGLLIQALALFVGGALSRPSGALGDVQKFSLLLSTVLLMYWLFLFTPLK